MYDAALHAVQDEASAAAEAAGYGSLDLHSHRISLR